MKLRKGAGLLLSLLLLTACGRAPELPAEEPEVPAIVVEEEPEIVLPVEEEPEETPVEELEPGWPVFVNGVELEESVRIQGVTCVPLEDLAQALDTTWVWNENAGGILWKGKWVKLYARVGSCFYGDNWCKLTVAPTVVQEKVYVPAATLCRGLEIGVYEDAEQERLYLTPAAGTWSIPEGYQVPVLMYHGVAEETWGASELFVRPSSLEEQLQYLVEHDYTPIWFEDLERVDQIKNPVILTFDDGYVDNYTELYPLLQKYQVKATIFVVTGTVDYNPRTLTSAQIRELSESGLVSIQSHTHTHPYLDTLSREEQERELTVSKEQIIRMTGKEPYVLCYPSGRSNGDTRELAKTYYRMGINMNGGDYITGDDPYTVSRWYVSRAHTLAAVADMAD